MNKELEWEIHVTDDNGDIIEYLKHRKLPYLVVDMLDKESNTVLRDHMSSIIVKGYSIEAVKKIVLKNLVKPMVDKGIVVTRIKIEIPPIEEYFSEALYIESHFETTVENKYLYPLSYLVNKGKYVSTAREYNPDLFKAFRKNYPKSELCVVDTNQRHDESWFQLY